MVLGKTRVRIIKCGCQGVIGAMERAIIFMSTVQHLGKNRVSVSQVKHVSWILSAVFICFCALILAVSLCPAVKITSTIGCFN